MSKRFKLGRVFLWVALLFGASLSQVIENTNDCLTSTYHFKEYSFPEPPSAACTTVENTTATIQKVYFAQTHVMEPDWTFFFLI